MLSHHKSIAVSKTIVGGKLEMENSNVLQEKKNPLTEGDIFPALIRFALPVLGALFLQSLYGAVDLLVVGKFSASSDVSAVSNGAQIMATLTNVLAAFAMGTTVLIGQLTGQKNREEAGRTVGASLVFFSVLGIALSIVMMIFAPQAAHIMKVPREAFPAAVSYLRICGGGICVITWYNLIGSIFRAVGDSRTPLIAVMLACAGNVAGDLLFVAVFHMGAAGAAAATVGSQALSVLLSLRMLAGRQLPFAFRRNMLAWDSARIRKILGIGTPIAIQDFLVSISFLIIQAIVNTLGVTASAGVGVAEKVCGFIMLVPSSFMQSLAAFVSQNIGADRADRAVRGLRYAIFTSLAVGAGLGYLSFFHGGVLTGLFSNDPAVIQAGWDYLRAYAIDCMLTPIFFCFIGFYNGVERTKFVMLQGIVSAFLVRVPVSLLMSRIQPVSLFRIGLATPASSLLQIVLSLIYYHSLKRELKRQHEKKYI